MVTSKQVEIFEVKNGYKLFQIAYTERGEYLLYKVFDPWYGFLNILPFIQLNRPAQKISEEQASLYLCKREPNKSSSGLRVSLAMILATILTSNALNLVIIMKIHGIKILLLLLGIVLYLMFQMVCRKKATEKNELIKDYIPNIKISLQSSNLIGRGIALIFFSLTLISTPNFQIFMIPFFGFYLIPALFDFYPDIKKLAETGNKIRINS
ncbi:TrkA-N domain protein [Weissella oryzae SG25]|uniref:TrkA-N domain protein n=1 Tax=Weissella oryzae (strain DSM 25784 / JCM 18191 / LMG 30913 / SG25) TaxID=1329250 RepID=A0A069CRU2_WEIOS|nr:hypothetical protein [Weissella oryzae]GAK30124.1 TrkA-N domain protein [Weissella oryzae SG25]